MEEKDHIPKYAAGDEMDRLYRPNPPRRNHPSIKWFICIIAALLIISAHKGFISIPGLETHTSPYSSAGTFTDSSAFEMADLTCDYDPDTGIAIVSGTIRAANRLSYNTKLTLEFSCENKIFYSDTQAIGAVTTFEQKEYSFSFNLDEQRALHGISVTLPLSYQVRASGQTHF